MAREIRISIDDDEVFERMKVRKRELELSWEDVLHRGLRHEGEDSSERSHDPAAAPRDRQAHRDDRSRRGRHSDSDRHSSHDRRGYREPPPDPLTNPSGFAEDLKRQIQGQVRESLHTSLGPDSWDDPLERDVDTLESAEDAALRFEFLGDDGASPAHQVPLRVTLEASADGVGVDVVAVRQGKGVSAMNAFDPAARQRVLEGLATGETATLELEFDAGVERYAVAPSLSWSRDETGRPTVVEVSIDEVRVDAE